jgi:hypothetical protein
VIAHIYALKDPRSGEYRYVGKTSKSLEDRLRYHIRDAQRRRHSLRRFTWILGLLDEGLSPEISLLETVSIDWQAAEKRWIRQLRSEGCNLLNSTAGGDGCDGMVHSAETKAAMSESAKKRYKDPEARRRTGEAVRAAFQDPVKREKLRIAAREKFARPEVRAALVAAARKAAADPARNARLSAAMKGRVVSEEARRKLSAARIGKKLAPEVVERIRLSHIGLKRSERTKALQSAAQKARFSAMSETDLISYSEARKRVWSGFSAEKRAAIAAAVKKSWEARRARKVPMGGEAA